MTYQQLLDRLKEFNAEQLEQTVTTFDSYTGEYTSCTKLRIAEESDDRLEATHPFLVMRTFVP